MTNERNGGYTLAEALFALVLAAVLMVLLSGVLSAVARLAATQLRIGSAAETERVVAAVLGGELRALARADRLFHDDSVRLRAFRGGGPVCLPADGGLAVRYAGVRLPEPEKDSVLLIWADRESVLKLEEAAWETACAAPPGEPALRIRTAAGTGAAGAAPAYALFFETGAYSLGAAAFRYRRGAGGRQPLTESNLSDSVSSLVETSGPPAGGSSVLVTLLAGEAPAAAATVWTIFMPEESRAPGASP